MRKLIWLIIVLSIFVLRAKTVPTDIVERTKVLTEKLLPNEYWWGGATRLGSKMPYGDGYFKITAGNHGERFAPLLISSKGRFIWCDGSYKHIVFTNGTVTVEAQDDAMIRMGRAGKTLRDAYLYTSKTYFPFNGKLPGLAFFTAPQFNTWCELTFDETQENILRYAHAIVDNGFKPGVLMIDGGWQEVYGTWRFHTGRFQDPKKMMDELHALGFKVLLWTCPYMSPDSYAFRKLWMKDKSKYFIMDEKTKDVAIGRWWAGRSAMLDLTSPDGFNYYLNALKFLQDEYGVDGFKFDAGDTGHYTPPSNTSFKWHGKESFYDMIGKYQDIGLHFEYSEYRATWKHGGLPLMQRVGDLPMTWEGTGKMPIPLMIANGLMGYPYTSADMIGGGLIVGIRATPDTINQEMFVRSAQIQALSPMMQFSLAPWRVLDAKHFKIVKDCVALREKMLPRIMQLAHESAQTGEPILRSMEYVFPGNGYEKVVDQFMLGNDVMVAPQVSQGTLRTVLIPPGTWKDDLGEVVTGPKKLTINVPLERLPYYMRIEP